MLALVELFADTSAAHIIDRHAVTIAASAPEDQLLAVLDEVILTLDTNDAVPISAEIACLEGGGVRAILALAETESLTNTGPVPKAIARSELLVRTDGDGVSARFLVDV